MMGQKERHLYLHFVMLSTLLQAYLPIVFMKIIFKALLTFLHDDEFADQFYMYAYIKQHDSSRTFKKYLGSTKTTF